jgi:hypothetical protein
MEGFDAIIQALMIFRKYGNPTYPFHCEHDTLYIIDIDPKEVSNEDKEKLDNLGFFAGEEDCFVSYRYGSA